MSRKRICIISYSPIKSDGRVLRQIEYLAPDYDLTVVGFGAQPDIPGVDWQLFPDRDPLLAKIIRNGLQTVGRVIPAAYDLLEVARARYWITRRAVDKRPDAVLADDLTALPIAAHLARKFGAKLVFDAHEYSPLEQETPKFKRLETPNRTYLIRKYAPQAAATITVCAPIAERYEREFGFRPMVVMSAPKLRTVADHPINPERIRLIHHGKFSPDRQPEVMIHALAQADKRFELYFMLVATEAEIEPLRRLADEVAPGRVFFVPPVPPAQVVSEIAKYDAGFYVLAPTNYNNQIALPNKFFDFIVAGLAVVIGSSPAMAQLVREYEFGVVASSFTAAAAAAALNSLTVDQLISMRAQACVAAQAINADTEMAKLITLFKQLLGE